MDDVHFSWTDSFQAAVGSCLPACLPCFKSSDSSDTDDAQTPRPRNPAFAHAIPPPRARPDELAGLLADASDDADALSLRILGVHSYFAGASVPADGLEPKSVASGGRAVFAI